jgi:hypothetical protein
MSVLTLDIEDEYMLLSFGPLRALIPAEQLITDICMFVRALLTAAPLGILKSVLPGAFFRVNGSTCVRLEGLDMIISEF